MKTCFFLFQVAEGDIIMYLNIFDAYSTTRSSYKEEKKAQKACKEWCNRMFINHRVMEKVGNLVTKFC